MDTTIRDLGDVQRYLTEVIARTMMVSKRKIQELLSVHFDAHGWDRSDTWKADSHPTVLTEIWTVRSIWSPSDFTIYVGFENWDVFDTVGVAMTQPVPYTQNDWDECVILRKDWRGELEQLLQFTERRRQEFGNNGEP